MPLFDEKFPVLRTYHEIVKFVAGALFVVAGLIALSSLVPILQYRRIDAINPVSMGIGIFGLAFSVFWLWFIELAGVYIEIEKNTRGLTSAHLVKGVPMPTAESNNSRAELVQDDE